MTRTQLRALLEVHRGLITSEDIEPLLDRLDVLEAALMEARNVLDIYDLAQEHGDPLAARAIAAINAALRDEGGG